MAERSIWHRDGIVEWISLRIPFIEEVYRAAGGARHEIVAKPEFDTQLMLFKFRDRGIEWDEFSIPFKELTDERVHQLALEAAGKFPIPFYEQSKCDPNLIRID